MIRAQQFHGVTVLARRQAAGALTLILCAATTGWAQAGAPRALDAAARSERLDVQRALAARPAVKMSVRHPGWYRVGQPQLVPAGLAPNTHPHNLRVFADRLEQ